MGQEAEALSGQLDRASELDRERWYSMKKGISPSAEITFPPKKRRLWTMTSAETGSPICVVDIDEVVAAMTDVGGGLTLTLRGGHTLDFPYFSPEVAEKGLRYFLEKA